MTLTVRTCRRLVASQLPGPPDPAGGSPNSEKLPAELHLAAFQPADKSTAEILRRRWA
jgi:hypothetical protein